MKWAGMFPAATLWPSGSITEVAQMFFDVEKPLQRPLDAMIEKIIDCRSAAEVVVRLHRNTARSPALSSAPPLRDSLP